MGLWMCICKLHLLMLLICHALNKIRVGAGYIKTSYFDQYLHNPHP